MDYKYNRRYFDYINWIWMSVIILIGIVSFYFYWFIGIPILLGVGTYIFFKFYQRPLDTDIDLVYERQVHQAIERGYRKLNLHPADVQLIDPIVIHGPLLTGINFDPVIIRGKDQSVRSSIHDALILYFSEKQMYFYKYSFSIIDAEVNETFGVIFYQDIVSVSTSSKTTRYLDHRTNRERFFNSDVFQLTTAGGTSIECSIRDIDQVESSIESIKEILRKKKSAS